MTRTLNSGCYPDDPRFWSTRDHAAGYGDGSISSHAVIEAHRDRTAARDGSMWAHVIVHADAAREDGATVECRFRAGTPLGSREGVPVALKDRVAIAGTVYTAGMGRASRVRRLSAEADRPLTATSRCFNGRRERRG